MSFAKHSKVSTLNGVLVAYHVPLILSHDLDNYIDGSEFRNLSLDELKSMCPLGIAKKIFRLISTGH